MINAQIGPILFDPGDFLVRHFAIQIICNLFDKLVSIHSCSIDPVQLRRASSVPEVFFSLLLFLSGQFSDIELPEREKFCNVYLLHYKGRYLPCRPFFMWAVPEPQIYSRAALQPAQPLLGLEAVYHRLFS